MTTWVVVPCFDEAGRLDVDAFDLLVDRADRVVFVDDGSTDATASVIEGYAGRRDGVELLPLAANVGKAEAVRTGMRHAVDHGATLVGYLDADLATPAAEMCRLIDIARSQPRRAAVIGSRVALLGHSVVRRPARHYLGRLYATAASLALEIPVYDTQCGAKVFRVAPPLRHALSAPFADRWAFDVELLARLLRHPDQHTDAVLEVPLETWHDVAGSRVSATSGLRAAAALLGLRRRVRRHLRRAG